MSSLTSAEVDLTSLLFGYDPLNHFTLHSVQLHVRCDYSLASFSGFLSFTSTTLLQMVFHLHCFIFYQNLI